MKKRGSQSKGKQKPDYQRLKEILKSDEFLGREKFEELRRQFGCQGREIEDDALEERANIFVSNYAEAERHSGKTIVESDRQGTPPTKGKWGGDIDHGQPMSEDSTKAKHAGAISKTKVGSVSFNDEDTGLILAPGKENAKEFEIHMTMERGRKKLDRAAGHEFGAGEQLSGESADESGTGRNGCRECKERNNEEREGVPDIKEKDGCRECPNAKDREPDNDAERFRRGKCPDATDGKRDIQTEEDLKEDVWRRAERRFSGELTLEMIEKIEVVAVEKCRRNGRKSSSILEMENGRKNQNSSLAEEKLEGKEAIDNKDWRPEQQQQQHQHQQPPQQQHQQQHREEEKYSDVPRVPHGVNLERRASLVESALAGSDVKTKQRACIANVEATKTKTVTPPTTTTPDTTTVTPPTRTTPAEVKTQNWLLRSVTNAKLRREQRQSECSADGGIVRDIVSPDIDNGDSGIYEDFLKNGRFSNKQKSSTFDASCLPMHDADEETRAYWDCVLSSPSQPESEYSIRISDTNSNIRKERFKRLTSSVHNKWASFSSSFLKLRRQSRTNHALPLRLRSNCGIEHVKVLQDTVQAMQNCVVSLEGLELRLKAVLKESKSFITSGEANASSNNCAEIEAENIAARHEKAKLNRLEGKVITKEQLFTISERLAKKAKNFENKKSMIRKEPRMLWMRLVKRIRKANGVLRETATERDGWIYDAHTQLD